MRNYQEGYFTRWHTDLGYPNLYPGLRKLYPDHSTLPEPTAVLQWQQDYQDVVELLRADYADNASNAAAKLGNRQVRIEDLQKSLRQREEIWSPPPHRSRWKTPVPEQYFRQANCGCCTPCTCKPWKLDDRHDLDLVPYEQRNLSLIHI